MTVKQAKAALQLAQMEFSANETEENKALVKAAQATYDSLAEAAKVEPSGDAATTQPLKPAETTKPQEATKPNKPAPSTTAQTGDPAGEPDPAKTDPEKKTND